MDVKTIFVAALFCPRYLASNSEFHIILLSKWFDNRVYCVYSYDCIFGFEDWNHKNCSFPLKYVCEHDIFFRNYQI